MIERILEFSLRQRAVVLLATAALLRSSQRASCTISSG